MSDSTILKASTDNTINVFESKQFALFSVKNVIGKGDKASCQKSPFSTMILN